MKTSFREYEFQISMKKYFLKKASKSRLPQFRLPILPIFIALICHTPYLFHISPLYLILESLQKKSIQISFLFAPILLEMKIIESHCLACWIEKISKKMEVNMRKNQQFVHISSFFSSKRLGKCEEKRKLL